MNSSYPLRETLVSIGFGEKEANVYLALLNIGQGTVSQIARGAGINRTTGYDILDSLVSKGFVSISGKEPKQEYMAESPAKIIKYYQDQVQKNQEYLKVAEGIVPELSSLHNVTGRPKVRFYEGKEGLQEVYEDTLTSHEPIRAYANAQELPLVLPNFFPEYYHRRAKKGIPIRGIFPDNKEGRERSAVDKEEYRESVLVPDNLYHFSPEINVYDNKVMIASWREMLGIIIESREIADAMKKIYDLSWEEAKRLDRNIRLNTPNAG